jgi:hypothetical protein
MLVSGNLGVKARRLSRRSFTNSTPITFFNHWKQTASVTKKKKGALSSLIFLKEKRNGTVKAQSCANGSVQWEHVAKEDAASPTVALESVFVTAAIDAKENREVVTIDIPGAFLHATNDDYVVMRMNGTLTELMAKTDPNLYRKYLTDEKGKKVLYLRLQKALYGMMKSALLFYRKLISELKGM